MKTPRELHDIILKALPVEAREAQMALGALMLGVRESSACDRRDWCVCQVDHRPPCRSTLFDSMGVPR